MRFDWMTATGEDVKRRTHTTKDYPHPTEPGKRICIQGSGLLHAKTDKGFEDIEKELPDYNFPEGVEFKSKAAKHKCLDLPAWGRAEVEEDGRVVRVYDRAGVSIFKYHSPAVRGKDAGEADNEPATYAVEKGALYIVPPAGLKAKYPIKAFDDTDTGSTNNKDAYIDENAKDTNYNNTILACASSAGYRLRPVMEWTLSAGSGPISDIKLYLNKYFDAGTVGDVEVHELTQAFVEAQVTWNSYSTGNAWASAGGDYSATIVDSIVDLGAGSYGWENAVLVGAGATNPMTLTWGDTFDLYLFHTDANLTKRWRSRSYATAEDRPYVEITYTEPVPVTATVNCLNYTETQNAASWACAVTASPACLHLTETQHAATAFIPPSHVTKHVNAPVVLVSIAWNSGTRHYAQTYVRAATRNYKGNLLTLPQLTSAIGDIKRTYERSKITLIFNDSDYEFRGLEDTETVSLKNRTVTISLAFAENNYASPLTLYTGQIYDWRRLDGLRFQIDVEEKSTNLDNEYPSVLVTRTDYASAHSSAIGMPIPIPYGAISADGLSQDGAFGHPSLRGIGESSTGCLFVCTTQDAEKHLVGLQASAITVDRVYLNGALQTEGEGEDYTVGTATIDGFVHTTIDWESGVRPTEADLVTCDVTYGTRRPVEAIKHFLINFCGYVDGDFNSTKYTAAAAVELDRAYDFAGAVWSIQALRTILDEWRDQWELDIYWDRDGLICFRYLTSTLDTSPPHYRDPVHILNGFESDPQTDKIINKLRYGWKYHYAKAYNYEYATTQSTDSQTKYGGTYEDYIGFRWTRTDTVALDIAGRKILRLKNPIIFDTANLPLPAFLDDLASMVKITHYGGGGDGGTSARYFQIRAMTMDLDRFVATCVLEDSSAFFGPVTILGDRDSLDPLWTDADASDQEYLYLCDESTGEFSDGEPGKQLFG